MKYGILNECTGEFWTLRGIRHEFNTQAEAEAHAVQERAAWKAERGTEISAEESRVTPIPPQVELKNVKHSKFASEETPCFQAAVWIDGAKAGDVSNDGKGGAHHWFPYDLERIVDAHAATLPHIDIAEGLTNCAPMIVPQSAEVFINRLLDAHLNKQALKRHCARKTLFRKPGETYQDGEYNTIAVKYCPAVKTHLTQKYGADVLILNETI